MGGRLGNVLGEAMWFANRRIQSAVFAATLLLPPAALMYLAHESIVLRYVLQRVETSVTPEDGKPGDIVAVTGRMLATPVRMPAAYPQFDDALMVVRLEERRESRRSWSPTDRIAWVSEDAAIGQWRLGPPLIERAGFASRQASPCFDFAPPSGWQVDCRKDSYAYRVDDADQRLSYRVTPLLNVTMTVVARVAPDGALIPIQHDMAPKGFVIWALGENDARAMIISGLRHQLDWIMFWTGFFLVSIWVVMFRALRGRRDRSLLRCATGAAWRSVLTIAPLAALAWPFGPAAFFVVAILSGLASAAVGVVFWLRSAVASSVGASA